jgi:hypothetical protein
MIAQTVFLSWLSPEAYALIGLMQEPFFTRMERPLRRDLNLYRRFTEERDALITGHQIRYSWFSLCSVISPLAKSCGTPIAEGCAKDFCTEKCPGKREVERRAQLGAGRRGQRIVVDEEIEEAEA